jgi:hypothetical protein
MRQHIERNESSSEKGMRGERRKKICESYPIRSAIIAYTASKMDPFLSPVQRISPSFTLIPRKRS